MNHKIYALKRNKILFKLNSFIFLFILIVTAFSSYAQYRPLMGTARGYAVFAAGNLVDNNPYQVKGQLGVMGTLSGTDSLSDSTIVGSGFPNDSAYYYLQEIMNELDALSGTSLTMTSGNTLTRGTYSMSSTTMPASGTFTLQGGANDVFVFKVNGDLEIGSDFRFILDGVQAKNIFWYINGNLTVASLARMYGAFYVYYDASIASGVQGQMSLLAKDNITMGSSDVYVSYNIMEPMSFAVTPCPDICVNANLIFNGDFSNPFVCIPFSAGDDNGFETELREDLNCAPPILPSGSGKGLYVIANNAFTWQKSSFSHVRDHTTNPPIENFMLVDGWTNASVLGPSILWEQTVTVEPGADYQFVAWFANVNITDPEWLPGVNVWINHVNVGTLQMPNDTLWRSLCIDWTAGVGVTSAVIQIAQANFHDRSNGNDFGIDDIVFGLAEEEAPVITQTALTEMCAPGSVLLQIQNYDDNENTTYQWQLGGVDISGATASTYIATISGNYTVVAHTSFNCNQISNTLSVTISIPANDVTNYTATSNATWTKIANPFSNSSSPVRVRGTLRIAKNVNLKIQGMEFRFANNATVIIEDGATLTLEDDGGGSHTVFTGMDCANWMWQGVRVLGKGTGLTPSVGKLVMKANSKIEHARIGVDNYDPSSRVIRSFNGTVEATGAIFHNNHIAARLSSLYSVSNGESPGPSSAGVIYQNKSFFQGCTFISDNSLRDAITYPNGLHRMFISLDHINGVKITGSTFTNSFYNESPPNVNNVNDNAVVTANEGITAFFASYEVGSFSANNTFTNLWAGIDHNNGGKAGSQNFLYNHFLSTTYGIIVRGGMYFIIENEFAIDPEYTSTDNGLPRLFIGINARGNTSTNVERNTFTDGYCGIVTVDWGKVNAKSNIRLNEFTNVGRINRGSGQSIYNFRNNRLLQVKCNDFLSSLSAGSVFVRNHWVTNGIMDNQGACGTNSSPANNKFRGYNPTNADILVIAATLAQPNTYPFPYNAFDNSSDMFPKMMQGGVDVTSIHVNNCNNPGGYNNAYCNIHLPLNKDSVIDIIDSILTNDPQDVTAIPYIYEVLSLMSDSDSTYNERIAFLSGLSIDTAQWMLLPFYASKGDYESVGNLIGTVTPSDTEQLYTVSFYNLMFQLALDTNSWKDMSYTDSLYLEEIAASNTHIAYEAQSVLSYVYNRGFSIPLPYVEDEEPARKGTFAEESNVKVFPNPVTDELNIHISKLRADLVIITDIMGRQVKYEVLNNNRGTIYTNDLRDGIYFVRIFNGEELVGTKKVVIIH